MHTSTNTKCEALYETHYEWHTQLKHNAHKHEHKMRCAVRNPQCMAYTTKTECTPSEHKLRSAVRNTIWMAFVLPDNKIIWRYKDLRSRLPGHKAPAGQSASAAAYLLMPINKKTERRLDRARAWWLMQHSGVRPAMSSRMPAGQNTRAAMKWVPPWAPPRRRTACHSCGAPADAWP